MQRSNFVSFNHDLVCYDDFDTHFLLTRNSLKSNQIKTRFSFLNHFEFIKKKYE